MSLSPYLELLLAPVAVGSPCGEDLESLLAEFGPRRLLGGITPLGDGHDWRALRDQALAGLRRSHDLRLLPYLAAAVLRLEGISAGLSIIEVARLWLEQHWEDVYPALEDGDASGRVGAVSGLGDRMAIVDALRRAPIVRHKQSTPLTLRQLDLMTGKLKAVGSDKAPTEAQVRSALDNAGPNVLQPLAESVARAADSLVAMRTVFILKAMGQFVPDFSLLEDELRSLREVLAPVDPDSASAALPAAAGGDARSPSSPASSGGASGTAPGQIGSRQDAVRALDAVAAFFRANEPSSPVPLFVERARRLVGKNFVELVTDVAPDALAQVRLAGGLRDDA